MLCSIGKIENEITGWATWRNVEITKKKETSMFGTEQRNVTLSLPVGVKYSDSLFLSPASEDDDTKETWKIN